MTPSVTRGLSPDEKALFQRIASSRGFGHAARMRELLLYIGDHAASPEDLTEQKIGVGVFGRPESYNPAADNIVRASARQLRTKLKEFYESEEGQRETLILDIPKGAYLPAFSTRVVPAESAPVPPPPQAAEPPRRSSAWLWPRLCALLLLVVAGMAWQNFRLRAVFREPASLAGQFLKQNEGPVRFVLTDSGLVALGLLHGPAPTLEKYADRSFISEGESELRGKPELASAWRAISLRQITSLADVGVLTRLLQTYPSASPRIEIRHARHMRTRDFKTGNFILTGSSISNPWCSLFDRTLNFYLDGDRVRNLLPQAGEALEYRNESTGRQWARIAFIRNLSGTGSVLLAAGIGFEGTEGAGEFVLNPDSLSEVRKLLNVTGDQPLPSFELLLETMALEGTARSSRIVAWRKY